MPPDLTYYYYFQCVHRDLACRNVLVADGNEPGTPYLMKISDFGLARNVNAEDDVYVLRRMVGVYVFPRDRTFAVPNIGPGTGLLLSRNI